MFCSKVSLTIDRPRLELRTGLHNRPKQFHLTTNCLGKLNCSLSFYMALIGTNRYLWGIRGWTITSTVIVFLQALQYQPSDIPSPNI